MIDAIITRLSTACDSLKTVSGPVPAAVLERSGLPAAFVYPTAASLPNSRIGPDRIITRIGVELIVEGSAALESLLAEVRAALANDYKPAGALTLLQFGGGRLEKIDGARLVWIDAWETQALLYTPQ